MTTIEKTLSALYRVDCPDTHTLGEYHLGLLATAPAQKVASHLQTCPLCRHELAELNTFLNMQPAPSLAEKLQTILARLIPQTGGASWSTAPVPVRGDTEGPRLYEAGDWQIAIEITRDTAHPDRSALLGMLLGTEPAPPLTVALLLEEATMSQTAVDETGNFSFSDIAPGRYRLRFSGDDLRIEIEEIEIG